MPGPEGVAAILVVVAVVAVTALGGGSGSGIVEPSASATSTSTAATPQPSWLVDRSMADLLIIVDRQLIEAGDQLSEEATRDTRRTAEIATLIREVNATTRYGADALPALGQSPEAQDLIERLRALYERILVVAGETLRSSISNDVAYESGSRQLVEIISGLPALQVELEALREARAIASAPATTPGTSAPPAATEPPASDGPDPSASPSTIASQVVNGGFEDGVERAWRLNVAEGVTATIEEERVAPAAGLISARIDLAAVTPAYAGVSLRQTGVRLEAGAPYTLQIALRADAPRDVRVRITSSSGDSYLTRIAGIGLGWSNASFAFLAPASDDDAVIEIELGRSDATTWIDAVFLGPTTEP